MKKRISLLIAATVMLMLTTGLSLPEAQETSPAPGGEQASKFVVITDMRLSPTLQRWGKLDINIGELYSAMLYDRLKGSKRFMFMSAKERIAQIEEAKKAANTSGSPMKLRAADCVLGGTVTELVNPAEPVVGFGLVAPSPQPKKEGKGEDTLRITIVVSFNNIQRIIVGSEKSTVEIPYDGKTPLCPAGITGITDRNFTGSPLGKLMAKSMEDLAARIEKTQIKEIPPPQK